jgi:trypsin-like peptidase
MSEAWARPVARIRCGNDVVGAGMLAPGGVVLTCAHVIVDALRGTGVPAGPDAKVTLDLPFAGLRGIAATVAKDSWHPEIPEVERGAGSPPSDLAVLQLPESDSLATLEACLVAETDPSPDTAFSAQGFPVGYPNGALAQGRLRGADAGGRLDAVADTAFGHFVDPGFSGAPVFAGQWTAIIPGNALGICVTNDAGGKRVARIISPAHLARALRVVISPYR